MNPFNPAFGSRPERFIGREDIAHEIILAVDDWNSPWRTTLITGIRGSGKTALLSDIEKKLSEKQVVVVSLIPGDDFLDNVLLHLYDAIPKSVIKKLPQIKSIKSVIEVTFEQEKDDKQAISNTFQHSVVKAMTELKKCGKRVIFLIDETQKHSEELRTFVGTYQILIRQEYPVSLTMAGLPDVISDILNDSVLTFLRRAHRITLQNVPSNLVKLDYSEAFRKGGFPLSDEQLKKAVFSTRGYPYLIQLIGYYLWIELEKNDDVDYSIDRAISLSKNRLFINVHELIYAELSSMDREFVKAMAIDENDSYMADIMKRLGKERNYISNYRARLLATGLIKNVAYGKVCFGLPYMRDFIIQLNDYEDF